ncbi:MAG: hypothetical protein QGG50_07465 [Methanopyri archaeon]|nr:hypothetical protein [Methanopyri archaeon]
MRRSVASKVLVVALLAALVPCAALNEDLRLELVDTLVPGHVAVVVANDGDACVSSSIAFDVRIGLALELVREVEGRTVLSDAWTSVKLDRPLCPGETRTVHVPVTRPEGTVTSVQLLRTEPRSKNTVDVLTEREVSSGFTFGTLGRYFALIGIDRAVTLVVSLLLVLLALNCPSSSRYYRLLWITVIIVIIASRWSFLTAPRPNGTDPYHVLEEARTIADRGAYPPPDEQVRPLYAYGFNFLLAAILLLTGGIGGVLVVPFLALPIIVALSRRLDLPRPTTPFAALLLFTHTYHIAMTANVLPSIVSFTLMAASVLTALVRARHRSVVLFLLSLTVGVSHAGGFLYLVLALACVAAYVFAVEGRPVVGIGGPVCLTALICLVLLRGDDPLFEIGLLSGLLIVLADRFPRPSGPLVRTLMVLGGAVLVITMNSDVREYFGSRAFGGTALGLLVVVSFLAFKLRREQLELPFLLSLPHVLWSISAIPLLDITVMEFHRMRVFLVSLLGLSLLGGRALAALMDSACRERVVRTAIILILSTGLLWSHLDRAGDIGVEPDRLHLPVDYGLPLHPAGDLRDVARFVQTQPGDGLYAFESPGPYYVVVDKTVLLKGWNIPILDRDAVSELCSRRTPPPVSLDIVLRRHRPGIHAQLVRALEDTCYTLAYSNPTFTVYAPRS